MRRRRPRFAWVLTAILAVAAVALVLNARRSAGGPSLGRSGPASACVTGHARARDLARTQIVATATETAPVRVAVQATGPRGTATVTRSGAVTARVSAHQPVSVTETASGTARSCATGASKSGARTLALRRAYGRALGVARGRAIKAGARSLHALVRREFPSVLAKARADAAARARRSAVEERSSLSAQARARARTLAGG